MKAVWILLPAMLVVTCTAQAGDIYCFNKGGTSPAGTELTDDWYVVNSKVRKPQLPGQTKPTVGCRIDFSSVGGMYRPIEVITRPKLGDLKTSHNALFYRSDKNGEDQISVRFHRVGRTGQLESSIIHLRVHVVDKPL